MTLKLGDTDDVELRGTLRKLGGHPLEQTKFGANKEIEMNFVNRDLYKRRRQTFSNVVEC